MSRPSASPSRGYLRVCEIAQGGMGYVELVLKREGRFQRYYAVKRLHVHYRSDPGVREMFMDEARLAGLLRHPNIVSVHDVGEDGEGPYLVMDFVDGVPVARIIARAAEAGAPVPLQIAVRIAMEAARGLHAAHEARGADGAPLALVHRDVSPQNILVGHDGGVRLTDFGIAKALGNSTRTATGLLKANMGYASPEQLRFDEPDRRSDLFSLGVTLFELLAGERLYANRDGLDGPRRILSEPAPDLGDHRPEAPLELVELCFELLAKERDHRPATAGDVAARLETALAALVAEEGNLELAEYMRLHFGAERSAQEERLASLRREAVAREGRRWARRWRWPALALGLVALAALPAAWRGGLVRTASVAPARPGAPPTVWAGGWHSCAEQDGKLYCWGKNNEGQLGIGGTSDRAIRQPVPTVGDVVSVGLGLFHTCACTAAGALYCWGTGADGQLGTGTQGPALEPVRVASVEDCRQVAAGHRHTCVLRAGGRVACWGANPRGQTGQPPAPSVGAPALVDGIADAVEIASDGEFTCARRASGAVLCWGANGNGQLGDGGRADRHAPAPVSGLAEAEEVALGQTFACARRRGGAVVCWGRPIIRRDRRGADRLSPVAVDGVTDAVQLTAGLDHLCALRRTGDLVCLGANYHGQLGDGSKRDNQAWVAVTEIRPVISIAAGQVHTCARLPSGVACWGRNETGQIGDGSKLDRSRPVSVAGF